MFQRAFTDNDLALLTLSYPVIEKPICLPSGDVGKDKRKGQ